MVQGVTSMMSVFLAMWLAREDALVVIHYTRMQNLTFHYSMTMLKMDSISRWLARV